ncbi:MAG: hypothetical protein HYS81_01055 [Candidatus Aenigmatarchaeota archaeon]|nr:MAG: hypothetical protein HYS81_01055 [Candidatus Aenigmarchaeota archaeon]
MAGEDTPRRFEDIESKLEELEDLSLTNKIEILELKSLLKNIQEGKAPATATGTALGPTSGAPTAPTPLPKDVVRALENLYKLQNAIQRRLDSLTTDVEALKKMQQAIDAVAADVQAIKRQRAEPVRPSVIAPPVPERAQPVFEKPPPVVGEIRIADIRSKIQEAKRIMGG